MREDPKLQNELRIIDFFIKQNLEKSSLFAYKWTLGLSLLKLHSTFCYHRQSMLIRQYS
jgi:hypothetical protein